MSQKKRKSSVYSLIYLNSINAITLIFLQTTSSLVYADQNSSSTPTASHNAIPTNYHFETGFIPIPTRDSMKTEMENENRLFNDGAFKIFRDNNESIMTIAESNDEGKNENEIPIKHKQTRHDERKWAPHIHTLNSKDLQQIILEYVDETLNKRTYEIMSGLKIEIGNKSVAEMKRHKIKVTPESERRSSPQSMSFDEQIIGRLRRFAETHVVNLNIPRAMQSTGRMFFFKSLKKFMWPIFIGMQVAKTVLLAMFLPSIIGSLGKIVGKGLSSVSGFAQPAETVDNLEFKDNYNPTPEMQETKYNEYSYPQGDTTANNNFAAQMYDSATANNALSRFGIGGAKVTYVQTPTDFSRNTNIGSMMVSTNKNDFKEFHDIPASSMLLTNYDPFYSPLLSRLDAVFQQMGLGPGNEKCREKLVCLMYASPAKYAPYSNLISAQLSRELNELKKPTSDNPDILRFFKYMRAAKDGQDRANCEVNFRECTSLKESDSQPAMIATYNDINKLVQARKL